MSNITTSEAWEIFFRILEMVILPGIAYISTKISSVEKKVGDLESTMSKRSTELEKKIDKVETVLIGADGRNGLRSRLRRLEVKVDRLAIQQASRHGEPSQEFDPDEDDEI